MRSCQAPFVLIGARHEVVDSNGHKTDIASWTNRTDGGGGPAVVPRAGYQSFATSNKHHVTLAWGNTLDKSSINTVEDQNICYEIFDLNI